jgi:hypothetical protein
MRTCPFRDWSDEDGEGVAGDCDCGLRYSKKPVSQFDPQWQTGEIQNVR